MPTIVYASFDVFPAPKGAAVHIAAFCRALGARFGAVDLLTVAAHDTPRPLPSPIAPQPFADGVTHWPVPVRGHDLVARVMSFRASLGAWWRQRGCVDVAHVRSIYEGYPIARAKRQLARRLVFEVNGLPSIELKYHHPRVAEDRELMRKLRAQEDTCIAAADLLVTPSAVTADLLLRRGARADRIEVVPNGVDPRIFSYAPPRVGPRRRWLYSGTMTAWQGVFVAIDALNAYRRDHEATLTLVGPARKTQRRKIIDRCHALGIADAVKLRGPVTQNELAALYHEHDVAIVPLLANDRNLEQGCCPLKLIEAMASGTPVVASDLEVVAQLANRDEHAVLVRPGSAKAVKDGVLRLDSEPTTVATISKQARARVEAHLTWEEAQRSLVAIYERLLS